MKNKATNLNILKQAAKKYGYKYGPIDAPYSRAIYISDGEKHFISRSKTTYGVYPINYRFAEYLVDDKSTTKRVLKKFGFRVIKGKNFYIKKPYAATEPIKLEDRVSAAYKYAKKITYPVFVKPNKGSRGVHAKIIFNETGMRKHIASMRKEGVISFLVEKFTLRPEYRIFVVAGKVQFMYRKRRDSIIGTGKHTIHELIQEASVKPDHALLDNLLKANKRTRESVLKDKEELILQDTANVSLGAEIVDYREKVPREVDRWASRLYRTIGLEVFGVDVFTKGEWDESNNYVIIEINSSPALAGIYNKGHKEKVYKIWKKIMQKYFLSS